MKILIHLSADLARPSSIEVREDDGTVCITSRPCLTVVDRASAKRRNATFDPLYRYGDMPAGTYQMAGWLTSDGGADYGPHGAIKLEPISGQALEAQKNGREGLVIHGGGLAMNADYPKWNGLRPTHSGVRCYDKTMLEIGLALLNRSETSCEVIVTRE